MAPHGVSQDSAQFSQTKVSPIKRPFRCLSSVEFVFQGFIAWAEHGVKIHSKLALSMASKRQGMAGNIWLISIDLLRAQALG